MYTSQELIDKLTRALEMEEAMSSELLVLSQKELLDADMPADQKAGLKENLSVVFRDTEKHKRMVAGLIAYIKRGYVHE